MTHFVLECLLYNPIIYVDVIIWEGSLKSFFQMDQQINIGLYLTIATLEK